MLECHLNPQKVQATELVLAADIGVPEGDGERKWEGALGCVPDQLAPAVSTMLHQSHFCLTKTLMEPKEPEPMCSAAWMTEFCYKAGPKLTCYIGYRHERPHDLTT